MLLYRIISIIIGYFCGIFLSGFFYGKKNHVDITKQGSGNVGTTNTLRILGPKAGAITLLCDCFKAVLAGLIAYALFHNQVETFSQQCLLILYGAVGAVLGHDFPFYMHFKGGKGIACSFGMILIAFPKALPLLILIFVVTVWITRYVSLGSILCAIGFMVEVYLFSYLGWLPYQGRDLVEAEVIATLAAILAIWLHRSNIDRLLHHNENKFSLHSSKKGEK
ncbi:glycerol-3-phosphate acyltransferase PlsY [Lachnospiraceae bacterium A10]|jgi:glycerol-3-phosphate acyltransferase PlsY|nr:glycerol-3-phosphate acyltransferase PlsY [Lachnospiraceae bacterium A10]